MDAEQSQETSPFYSRRDPTKKMQFVDPVICSLDEKHQLRVFTKNNIRLDGRTFLDRRAVTCQQSFLSINHGLIGSSRVQMDSTVVICGVNIMVGVPTVTDPNSGDVGT